LAWSILYGLPTLVFLILSVYTIACSVVSVGFQLAPGWIIVRALAAYMFGFVALLYWQLGQPQETDRLQLKDDTIANLQKENGVKLADLGKEKDDMIADLRHKADIIIADLRKEKQSLEATIVIQKAEIEKQNELLAESKTAQSELIKAIHKSDEAALQAYSEECNRWLKSGVKTASLDEVNRFSGHSKRKIENALSKGILQSAPRNKDLILMSSLVNWLKTVQPSTGKTDEAPLLHLVNE
jgi:hypothetical protein